MNQTVKKLINQGIFYNISVLIFQSFITFYIIKYFDGIQGAIVGNIVLYISVACGYIIMARVNHNKSISVKSWMFFAIVLCVLSTCMMQRNSMGLLLLGFVLLGLGKGVYFCSLYLYEFKYLDPIHRTKYSAMLNTWKSGAEIVVPLLLGYFFSVIPLVQSVYLIIFLTSAVMLVLTALSIYKLPEFRIKPIEHAHYKTIFKNTSRVAISYIMLIGLVSIIPFIGTLLEVQILTHESWTGIFQGATKGVTLVILLLILRFSHIIHPTRYFMILALAIGVALLFMPWWHGYVVLIIYVIVKSLLLSLFGTYQKPVDMKILESMSNDQHTMLPLIIIQEILHTAMRVGMLVAAYFLFVYFGVVSVTYGLILLTGLGFLTIGGLVFYYLYEKAHGIIILRKTA